MDLLDQWLADLGPEQKEQLMADVVEELSAINRATSPGPVLTSEGAAPAFPSSYPDEDELLTLDRGQGRRRRNLRLKQEEPPGVLAPAFFVEDPTGMVQFDPENRMSTANLQPDREVITPDLTREPPPGLTPSAAYRSAEDRGTAEISGETDYGEIPKGAKVSMDKVGMDPSTLFADPVAVEVADKVAQEALAPAKEASTESLAAQVGASPVMQPGQILFAQQPKSESSLSETRVRTRGVDRTNEQYQRRLKLSRLLELQALRQLQKAEETRARPRSLMDLYRGDYAKRSAQDAQRRINMAREYFNRSGAIQRELVKEKDIARKAAQAQTRYSHLAALLAERRRKAEADEKIRRDGLKLKEADLDWKKLKYDKMTPYQRAVVAVRRKEAKGREKDRANAMARRSRESWQVQVSNIQKKLGLLSAERRSLHSRLYGGGFMMDRERLALNQQLGAIEKQEAALEAQQKVFSEALDTQLEQGTNISKDKGRRSLDQLVTDDGKSN